MTILRNASILLGVVRQAITEARAEYHARLDSFTEFMDGYGNPAFTQRDFDRAAAIISGADHEVR